MEPNVNGVGWLFVIVASWGVLGVLTIWWLK
jgi:hypothetical protein